ncbi:PREDICTED: folylpolyglutamate synthase, mitochondrial [Chaetura pelagica]|uniref:folylpolyglutamate synthase, mitochondrial n=1 Tax=Chaetura pelagica TaxID=8897 RepID=UPI00052329A5|nr:PREDICTED: folylpolyglutamate synthase, mitochondrial [Chaetura pelagica]
MPAYFRFLTIMAFHVFLQEKVDLAVVEVGIGGAYDCTNIIRAPVVCGISALGIDHTSILGDTMEKIAWQKGGIFKRGVPAFTVAQPERPLGGLRDTEWLGRTQVLPRGPVTWYLDGAHTTSSIQACVRWFRQAALNQDKPYDGSEVRVLLFNATGDRDTAALLKLLVPCHFDYAIFCPNFTEVSVPSNVGEFQGAGVSP